MSSPTQRDAIFAWLRTILCTPSSPNLGDRSARYPCIEESLSGFSWRSCPILTESGQCLFLPHFPGHCFGPIPAPGSFAASAFPVPPRQIFLKRTEVLVRSWLRFQHFPPGDVLLTLCFCRFEIAGSWRVNPHATGLH